VDLKQLAGHNGREFTVTMATNTTCRASRTAETLQDAIGLSLTETGKFNKLNLTAQLLVGWCC